MRKPRIHRGPDGWRVTRPGYGFNPATESGPYASFGDAVKSIEVKTASAHSDIQRTHTPATARYREHIWPLEFR